MTTTGPEVARLVALRLKGDDRTCDTETLLARGIDSLGLDSLDHLELVMQVEETFGVLLDEEQVMACRTVADLAALADAALVRAA